MSIYKCIILSLVFVELQCYSWDTRLIKSSTRRRDSAVALTSGCLSPSRHHVTHALYSILGSTARVSGIGVLAFFFYVCPVELPVNMLRKAAGGPQWAGLHYLCRRRGGAPFIETSSSCIWARSGDVCLNSSASLCVNVKGRTCVYVCYPPPPLGCLGASAGVCGFREPPTQLGDRTRLLCSPRRQH